MFSENTVKRLANNNLTHLIIVLLELHLLKVDGVGEVPDDDQYSGLSINCNFVLTDLNHLGVDSLLAHLDLIQRRLLVHREGLNSF